MSDLLPWFICVLLGHIVTSYASKTTIYTCMDSHTMFLSVLLWLDAAYTPRIYLHHQETASTLINYIIVCGEYLKYGRSWAPPSSCIILRPHHFFASNADSGTHGASDTIYISVPYYTVVQTPEDVPTISSVSKEETGAVTTTKATTKSL